MRHLALLAAPLVAGCVSLSVRHAPGYDQTAGMKKERLSVAPQVCPKLCDLDGPRGRIEFRDVEYHYKGKRLGRDHTSFSIHYEGSVASCKGEGESPLRCAIDVPGTDGSELVLDPGCSTGRLADRGSTPLRLQVGTVTANHQTRPAIDLSLSDDRGVALYGQMGIQMAGIDVFTRGSDSATPEEVLAISAIYALLAVQPQLPTECLIDVPAEPATGRVPGGS
jgi:hypothetical protein